MGKNKKEKKPRSDSESESDSGPEDRNEPAPKKAKVPSGPGLKDDSGGTYFELEKNRRVTVREFRGKLYIDIREFYTNDKGETCPGKKGISMTTVQWNKLKSLIGNVDDEVQRRA